MRESRGCGASAGGISVTDVVGAKGIKAADTGPLSRSHAADGNWHEHVDESGTLPWYRHGAALESHAENVPAGFAAQAAASAASQVRTLDLNARILEKNENIAALNRAWLAGREILAINLMSASGAGKTRLLEETISSLRDSWSIYVLEGDQAADRNGIRAAVAGVRTVRINTGRGCHLDAEMVVRGIRALAPASGSLLFIENVANLVCPALFDLGERRRVAILSVTECDEKPLKYPHMFRAAHLLIIAKIDLLPHVDFEVDRAIRHATAANPAIEILKLSARTGEGMDEWRAWIRRTHAAAQAELFV
jgi:hydrogenase nickel incorporation protein HypB